MYVLQFVKGSDPTEMYRIVLSPSQVVEPLNKVIFAHPSLAMTEATCKTAKIE